MYLHVSVIGLEDQLEFISDRPARHCRICGVSFQPALARTEEYLTDVEVQWATEIELQEWSNKHNKTHTAQQHQNFRSTGTFLTPEATERLVPLGIIPIQDIVFSEEHAHAGRQAKRAPDNDVEGSRY